MRNMWRTLVKYVVDWSGNASGRKNTSPILFINTPGKGTMNQLLIYYHNNIIHTCTSWRPT